MKITDVYTGVFQNGERYTAQVNIGVVADSSNNGSILNKVMDRTQAVHFFTLARRSFASESEAENYVAQKKAEIEKVVPELEKELTENGAKLVTFTSDKPIRTRNQKRFGVDASHNRFNDRYVIRRVYIPELHGEFTNYIETVLGTVPEDHEIRENGERITVLLHSAVNVENADKVVADLVDLVEDQEIA